MIKNTKQNLQTKNSVYLAVPDNLPFLRIQKYYLKKRSQAVICTGSVCVVIFGHVFNKVLN